MIYLTEGNTPLNEAYNDEIVHLGNNTYQLTFRFPTSDPKWELLKEETFLTADDLHGEQDFYIFEVEKQQGYIQVYANQVISLLNNYIVSSIEVDRVSGTRVLSAFAGSITRANPFSFFSDIDDRHTLNIKDKNAMEVLAKGKHSILGQWGGDMVRNGYNLRLLKNGGSENESLFMYKKNLSSYQHKTSTKSLKTRITFKTTVKGEGENAVDHDYMVVIDSPLLGNYSQIYEDVVEVNDQDVTDEASLIEYGKQYFRTSMCDMLEDNLEISVVGQSDVAVQMFDVVSFYHEWYGLDVRKKITKYTYSPMAKLLKSIGFGTFQSSLANAIGGIVNDAVLNESRNLHQIFEERLKKEIANADRAFDAEFSKREKTITDAIELAKAKAEEVKQELSDTINQRFNSFDNGPLKEAKRKAEEALRNAGASSSLAQESKRIGLDSVARLEAFKSQTTSAQTALSGDLDALKRTIANDIRPKQAQAETEIAKQVEALSRTKNELAGVKSAQATYEETTTRRLSELTNLANGKASKSELTQTAEELASRIASVQAGSSRNYFRNSRSRTFTTGGQAVYDYRTFIVPDFWKNSDRFKRDYVRISFDVTFPVALVNDIPAMVHFSAHPWYAYRNLIFKGGTVERQHFEFTIDLSSSSEDYQTNNVFIRFGTNYGFPAGLQVVIENAMLSVGNYFPAYQPAYEDQEDRVSAVESNFKQRANSLEAGVNRLTEGLRTKADISSLNVTAENIRQSVKSLETDTQNKLNQKLSQAEFEVRAASVHLGRRNLLKGTKELARYKPVSEYNGFKVIRTVAGATRYQDSYVERTVIPTAGTEYIAIFYARASENDYPVRCHFYNPNTVVSSENSSGYKSRSSDGLSIIRLSTDWQLCWVKWTQTATDQAKTVIIGRHGPQVGGKEGVWVEICAPAIFEGNLAGDWSPAYEDQEDRVSAVESNFKQRADSLDAGVSRLTEGLRTKVDISALNVTAENIRQSVKSLETDTQNKLNQKLSQAEFEVRAGSIRQEILNATKDKADKTLVVSEAGKLREEFSKMKVGGRNLWIKSKTVGAVIEKLPENHVTGQKECYRLENNSTLTFNLEPDFSSRLYQKVTFSAWIKYENVVQGRNFWNVFNCFKHYLFRKNSETGVQSGPDYATLGMYKGSADWKYITFTYDYSEKTNFDQLKTSLRFNLEGATSGTAWVTGIKVEIGSVATDWSPALEDADGLITEAKATFERTAQGLRTDLSAIQEYVNKDGQRQEALQRYTREESTRQATAVRELVNRDFVGKATYQEDVKGINQRIEAVKTSANKDIASQIASYRQSVDGKFTDISSQITTYKQDVGGQISGLSNRLTSSEQGTTTQISNISNRINSNKQGTDNKISNLKTQVATNKDNAERQMGRISD
ncbi:phage tail spike protein, partial [Streptococcus pneumoniae]|uniref:phage tail spike protein n=1 Tax=Streptococcus pneumoniae TaxID=1313 RepID=UPI0017858E87